MLSNVASPAKRLKIFFVIHFPAVFYGYPMIDLQTARTPAGGTFPAVAIKNDEPNLSPSASTRTVNLMPRHYPASPRLRMLGGSDFLAKAPHARTKAAATSSRDAFWVPFLTSRVFP